MKWLLDTNTVSENVRPHPAPRVVGWISNQPVEQMAISVVTLAELRDGASLIPGSKRREQIEHWIDAEIVTFFDSRILPLAIDILMRWLLLARRLGAKGRPGSAPDLLIAATAWTHNLTVVSRNIRGFTGTGIAVFDPWTGNTHHMDAP